ncbi:MAG: BsaWI family type II restriction enzyme [Armatimonadota bacterium]
MEEAWEKLMKRYEDLRSEHPKDAWRFVSQLLEGFRPQFRELYRQSKRAQRKIKQGKEIDPDQAWRNFKGRAFERLILHMIKTEVESVGLKCATGDEVISKSDDPVLGSVYRQIMVRYGCYAVIPDVDLVIFRADNHRVIGVVSCKVTLRERIAQTAYWKLKLMADPTTHHIKVFFVTPDEDGDLVRKLPDPSQAVAARGFKNRILVEHELDGTYVLRDIEPSEKVKTFDHFLDDLRKLLRRCARE